MLGFRIGTQFFMHDYRIGTQFLCLIIVSAHSFLCMAYRGEYMIQQIILPIIFLLSFIGYSYCLYLMIRPQLCFIPVAVITFETVVVYFGGIAGILEVIVWLVAAVGAALGLTLLIELKWSRPRFFVPRIFWVGYVVMAFLFLLLLFFEHLQHYDNFSHWGIVVKAMLSGNAFPTTENRLIEFQNYPLGSSTWIYFVCFFCGRAEHTMLLAQGVLIFSLLAAILGMVKRKNVFLLYGLLAAGCSILTFFNITIRINNLLVDFLLPLFVLACWSIMQYYGSDLRQYVLLTPMMGMLLIIKSTGVIFCAFVVCGWIYYRFLDRGNGNFNIRTVGAAALSLLLGATTYLAWKYHMATVFAGISNKFETDASKIVGGGAKTAEEVQQILTLFLQTATDPSTRPARGFYVINAAVIVILLYQFLFKRRRFSRIRNSLVLLDLMTIAYYAGILAMYVYSMPMEEAATLAGFDRYASSIMVLFAGGVAIAITAELEHMLPAKEDGSILFHVPEDKQLYQKAVLILCMATLIILTSEYNGMRYNLKSYDTSLPKIMKSITGDRWNRNGKEDPTKYLFYGTDHNGLMTSYFFHYVARYYMYAPNIDAICSFYEDNLDNLLSGYEVLGIIEADETEKDMLHRHYGIDGQTGFYRITADGAGGVSLTKMTEQEVTDIPENDEPKITKGGNKRWNSRKSFQNGIRAK